MIAACLAEAPANRLARARILSASVQIAVAVEDLGQAEASVSELDSIARGYNTPMVHALAVLARGRLQLAEDNAITAGATLRDAVRRWQELEVPYEVATASTLLGQAQRKAGDDDAANASFATARALFERIGARLEACGLKPTRRQRPAGLTEREIEVLCLIADGRANKDIATQLQLSAKTVSRHLTNIYNKIGVTSRAGATAFAFEHQLTRRRV